MKPQKNALEWLVFGVSAVLVAGVCALLVVSGMRSDGTPPSLAIETGPPVASGDTFRVPVRVRNTGSATAEEARIIVELVEDGAVAERAEFTIPFVPQYSSREGSVSFRRDPSCCTVTARAAFSTP